MEYFGIVNWEKYQSYTRNVTAPPPWIKIYSAILHDPKTAMLSDAEFGQLVKLWITASQNRNKLPLDPEAIARLIGSTESVSLERFEALGLIERHTDCIQAVDKLRASCLAESESDKIRLDKRGSARARESNPCANKKKKARKGGQISPHQISVLGQASMEHDWPLTEVLQLMGRTLGSLKQEDYRPVLAYIKKKLPDRDEWKREQR